MAQTSPPYPIGTNSAIFRVDLYMTKRANDYLIQLGVQSPASTQIATNTIDLDPKIAAQYNLRPGPQVSLGWFGHSIGIGQVVVDCRVVIQKVYRRDNVIATSGIGGSVNVVHNFRYVVLGCLRLYSYAPISETTWNGSTTDPWFVAGQNAPPRPPFGQSPTPPDPYHQDCYQWAADPNLVPLCNDPNSLPMDQDRGAEAFDFCSSWDVPL